MEDRRWANETVVPSGKQENDDKLKHMPYREQSHKIKLIDKPFHGKIKVDGNKEIGYSTPKAPRKLKKLMKSVKRLKLFGSSQKGQARELRRNSSDASKTTADLLTSSEEIDNKSGDTISTGMRGGGNRNTTEIGCDRDNLDKNFRSTNSNMGCTIVQQDSNLRTSITCDSLDKNSRSTDSNMECTIVQQDSNLRTSITYEQAYESTRDINRCDYLDSHVNSGDNIKENGAPYALGKSRNVRQLRPNNLLTDTLVIRTSDKKAWDKCMQQPNDIEGDEGTTTVSLLTMTSPIAATEKKYFENIIANTGQSKLPVVHNNLPPSNYITTEDNHLKQKFDDDDHQKLKLEDDRQKPEFFCKVESDPPQHFCHTYIPNPQVEDAVEDAMRLLGLGTMSTGEDSDSYSDESVQGKPNFEHIDINPMFQRSTSSLSDGTSLYGNTSEEYSDSDLSSVASTKRQVERRNPLRFALARIQERVTDCLAPQLESPPTHFERRQIYERQAGRREI